MGRFIRAGLTASIAAVIAALAGVPGKAQPANAPAAQHLININRCDPQQHMASGGVYVPYSPAYYPGRPYYWNDPYGYRYYQPAIGETNGTLYLDYRNVTHKVMKTIDFGMLANGHLVAEVRDVGTFSPGAEIKHQFGLSSNVFPLSTSVAVCIPLHLIYADGATWRNPHLPALERALYGGK